MPALSASGYQGEPVIADCEGRLACLLLVHRKLGFSNRRVIIPAELMSCWDNSVEMSPADAGSLRGGSSVDDRGCGCRPLGPPWSQERFCGGRRSSFHRVKKSPGIESQ